MSEVKLSKRITDCLMGKVTTNAEVRGLSHILLDVDALEKRNDDLAEWVRFLEAVAAQACSAAGIECPPRLDPDHPDFTDIDWLHTDRHDEIDGSEYPQLVTYLRDKAGDRLEETI